jgi:hypothetical protein
MSWWDVDEEVRILRARVAKLEAENAELARRFPGPQSNVIPFPNGEESSTARSRVKLTGCRFWWRTFFAGR